MKQKGQNFADHQPNPVWATLPLFDRTSWKRVRFGDVVENCGETCDPVEAGLERFVAMEHLEPGSLHVRSWGNVADGTTFTRRCRPGQVLFGKRRAYQRKVAVAEFEAVVSGDIYVLAPKDTQRLLPELLPFLCLSERFFQHAVGTSAGSLSPRTNWSSLASFEFDLPPLDQQRRIAEILWAVETARRAYVDVSVDAPAYEEAATKSLLLKGIKRGQIKESPLGPIPDYWTVSPLTDLTEKGRPIAYGILQPGNYDPNGVLMILGGDFTHGWVEKEKMFRVTPDLHRMYKRSTMKSGDVIICIVGATTGAAAIVPDWEEEANLTQTSARISCDRQLVLPEFILAYLQSTIGRSFIRRFLTGSAQPRLNLGDFKRFLVPVPPVNEQFEIVERLQSIQAAARAGQQAAANSAVLLIGLCNQFMR